VIVPNYLREALSARISGDFAGYFAFVESCLQVEKGHRHHILPRKEFPEFAKDLANRICVTPGNHLLAHYYLALCAPDFLPFQKVFFLMAGVKKYAAQIPPSDMLRFSEVYEIGRREQKKQAQKMGQIWGPVNGRAAVESGLLARIQVEGAAAGGRANGPIQGLKNVESGQLRSVCAKGGHAAVESGHLNGVRAAGGRTSGKRNVESGLLAKIRTPESCAKGGRTRGKQSIITGFLQAICAKGGRASNHLRWHVNRGIVNPECSLCVSK